MSDRWVTFDCFGTLVDWHTGFSTALQEFAGDRVNDLLSVYHRYERTIESERPHRLYKDVLAMAVRRAASEIGLSITHEQAQVLPRRWGSLPVFTDVEPALAGLRSAGYRL